MRLMSESGAWQLTYWKTQVIFNAIRQLYSDCVFYDFCSKGRIWFQWFVKCGATSNGEKRNAKKNPVGR